MPNNAKAPRGPVTDPRVPNRGLFLALLTKGGRCAATSAVFERTAYHAHDRLGEESMGDPEDSRSGSPLSRLSSPPGAPASCDSLLHSSSTVRCGTGWHLTACLRPFALPQPGLSISTATSPHFLYGHG